MVAAMSVTYGAIGWNRAKKLYDATLAVALLAYIALFVGVGLAVHADATIETLVIRALGTAAFLMLHVILSIGPLCRLNRGLLPLLYNRRHLGVTTFVVAAGHALFALVQFHALGNVSPLVSLLTAGWGFQIFGLGALLILFVMAATSHDFWLANLGAPVWKTLHMSVYAAYAMLVLHVALGALRSESHSLLGIATGAGMVWLLSLHALAARREKPGDRDSARTPDGWIDAGIAAEIPEGRAHIVCAGERIAVFRYGDKVSAVSNVCRHQAGPLGEGRVIDGCITCPWHGFQYRPENGRSPAPFTERVPTFDVRVIQGRVFVNPDAHPPGTPVEPARVG
jgi:nitrite reductase/ring-hydroxylating ferredoxin subunit/DMSO/TMAO reductase YedYZ heme-binding membrane subunit